MTKRVAFFSLLASLVVVVGLPARAADDFNSSRSNRERGTLETTSSDTGPCRPPYLCDTVAAPQQVQDFNTTRSNKDKRGMKTTHVHGDPHVDQISVDEPGMPASSSSKRVLPTVNKRVTAADGPDQDCDGMAEELKTSETCPAATPVRAGAKGGKTGHVTILK